MKNIIIAGSARSGKSSLANIIKKKYPDYAIFHGDDIRNLLISIFGHEKAIKITHSEEMVKIVIDFLNNIIPNSPCPLIIEWSRIYPDTIAKLKKKENCIFIYLGHGGITSIELANQCRKFENEDDFTYVLSDTELLDSCERWAKVDNIIKSECQKYNLKYYNTSENRQLIFDSIIHSMDNG